MMFPLLLAIGRRVKEGKNGKENFSFFNHYHFDGRSTIDRILNGLVRYPPGNQVKFEPDLAKSCEVSKSGKVCTSALRAILPRGQSGIYLIRCSTAYTDMGKYDS